MAWSTIMICLSIYMAIAWKSVKKHKTFLIAYMLQWILNVGWSPVFFYFHEVTIGLILITLLTILIAWMIARFKPETKINTWLLLPYLLWLIIATSLNGFILINN
jgi:tryptophan-rich sensory protein